MGGSLFILELSAHLRLLYITFPFSRRSHRECVEQDSRGLIRIGHSDVPNLGSRRPVIPGIYRHHDGIGVKNLDGHDFLRQPLPAFKGHNSTILKP